MTRSSYLLCYSCTDTDGDTHEDLVEILAYSYEQAYMFARSFCKEKDIISLENTVKRCSY